MYRQATLKTFLLTSCLLAAMCARGQELTDTTAVAARLYMPSVASVRTGVTFSQWVASQGLNEGVTDLSKAGEVYMPEPQLAYVRVAGITTIPSSKRDVRRVWVEFYDGKGRYFRKPALLKGQGGYSLRFPKRNFSLQFCNEQWDEDEGTGFCFGDWVRQDGFHVKAFYTDFSRGIGEMGYKLFSRMVADRQPYPARQGVTADSRVRCFPDGFPCVVWLGEDLYGVCAWQLKKHRKNMGMKKTAGTHIHLDGDVSDSYLFDGRIEWSRFEVRNPKGLYCQNGKAYDGNSPRELMGSDSHYFRQAGDNEETVQSKQRSAQVKEAVVALSRYKTELQELEQRAGVTEQTFRAAFEQRFNLESLIDYYVFFRMGMNGDGTVKNWQWFTYNGRQWMVTPYDLDQTFGITLYGFPRPATHTLSRIDTGPFPFINRHYHAEETARYMELREAGVLDVQLIQSIIRNWYGRVGTEWYAMEMERWPESPCYCPPLCNSGWQVCNDWSLYNTTPAYSSSTTYHRGDRCILHGRIWEATATSRGVQPYIRNSDVDTLERLLQWVEDRLAILDKFYGYEGTGIAATLPADGARAIESVWSLSGQRLPMPAPGLNIIRYTDGTSRVVRY